MMKFIYDNNNTFPSCVYNQIISNIKNNISINEHLFPIITNLKSDYEKVLNFLCLRIPFGHKMNMNDYSYAPFLCMEINYTKVFEEIHFKRKEAIDLIFFSMDFIPIYTDKSEVYEDIKKVCNDTKFGNYSINVLKKFSFFHFLYVDIFKEPSLLKKIFFKNLILSKEKFFQP